MWPYEANSSSVYYYPVASLLTDGDINTFHATNNYMPSDAWTRVYFMSTVFQIVDYFPGPAFSKKALERETIFLIVQLWALWPKVVCMYSVYTSSDSAQ